MLCCVWSPKGGTGASVVAAGLALAGSAHRGTLLVDLDGDQSAILGLPDPGPGASDWLVAEAGAADLARLTRPVVNGLALIGPGEPQPVTGDRITALGAALRAGGHPVVVDAAPGGPHQRVATGLIRGADRSIVVVRACYLALRRFHRMDLPADGAVVIREPRRALEPREVGEVLGLPVLAVVDLDPAVSRAVDAGRFAAAAPRSLTRALRRVAA